MINGIYLLLGSNLGDKKNNLKMACDGMSSIGEITRRSSFYATAAWGNTAQDDFLNQAIELNTALPPHQLLEQLLAIETSLGRIRTEKWGPRTIDIDILFYRDEIINTATLRVPHPEIQNRRFALAPMNELAPGLLHPVLKRSIQDLLTHCPDASSVEKIL